MADFTTVPTVELLTRAADAAGDLAEVVGAEVDVFITAATEDGGLNRQARTLINRRLLVSGSSHWLALEGMLRYMLGVHQPLPIDPQNVDQTRYCTAGCHVRRWPDCPSLMALRPLAEQVLRDLGETP